MRLSRHFIGKIPCIRDLLGSKKRSSSRCAAFFAVQHNKSFVSLKLFACFITIIPCAYAVYLMFVAKKWKCNCNFIGHFRFAGNCITSLDFATRSATISKKETDESLLCFPLFRAALIVQHKYNIMKLCQSNVIISRSFI